jgi:glutamyl-tRNA reductase
MKKEIGVGIVGAGGMAEDITSAFADNASFSINFVCSRSIESALKLANNYTASATTKYSDLPSTSDVSLV